MVQAQVEDRADLAVVESVFAAFELGLGAYEDAEFFNRVLCPRKREELVLRVVAVARVADDFDEIVEVRECDEQRFQPLGLRFRFAQKETRAPQNDFATVLDVAVQRVLQAKQARASVIDGEHRGGECGFKLRVLVEVVQQDFWVCVALQLDDDARVFVRLVAHVADAGEHFFVREFGDALHEFGAVYVIRNLGDDDLLAPAFNFLDAGLAAHAERGFARLEILLDRRAADADAARREIGTFDVRHQPVKRDIRVVDLRADAVDQLAQIVRRYVRRHADRDARATVDEQVWKRGGKHRRFHESFVVARDKIHGILVHVDHQCRAEPSQPRLGVSHGCGRVAFNGTEVALPIDEHLTHRPRLRHVDEGGVDRLVAMRVVVAHRVADDLGALDVLAIRHDGEVVHRYQDAAL